MPFSIADGIARDAIAEVRFKIGESLVTEWDATGGASGRSGG